MWKHFHPQLNPTSHDFAAVLNSTGQVLAVRVPAPGLPEGVQVPRGNARHKVRCQFNKMMIVMAG